MFEIFVIWMFCKNRILEKRESFQKVHPLHTLEGKHSEPRHNIFGVIVDTFITPAHFEGLVISCDMIICMGACY